MEAFCPGTEGAGFVHTFVGLLADGCIVQCYKCSRSMPCRCIPQILLGLNHMHAKKILHRDIKTLNVFLDDDLNVKLGDMGVAKVRFATLLLTYLMLLP